MSEFLNPIDVCNRALQYLGSKRIDPVLGFTEISVQASECSFAYGKLRRAELRRNYWRFAIKRTLLRPINTLAIQSSPFVVNPTVPTAPLSPTMIISPALWSSSSTYPAGALVSTIDDNIWQSLAPANTGFAPGNSAYWDLYTGPLTVDAWVNQASFAPAYGPGDLVYTAAGDGTYTVFQSLMESNYAPPAVPVPWLSTEVYQTDETAILYPNWSSGTTYAAGGTVLYTDGNYYASLVAGNLNHIPPSSAAQWAMLPTTVAPVAGNIVSAIGEWNSFTTFTTGTFVDYSGTLYVAVAGSTGVIPAGNPGSWAALTGGTLYQSLVNLNQGFNPGSSPTQWTSSITSGSSATTWRVIPTELRPIVIPYPIGAGPTWQSTTRNAFRLPSSWLREAPQDPKAGGMSWLGAPSNLVYNDWNYDGDYIVSRESTAISYRFVSDMTNVSKFDDLFCEALAARLAYSICERVTQSTAKQGACAQAYAKFVSEARLVNGIEEGPTEAPLDDFIAARI